MTSQKIIRGRVGAVAVGAALLVGLGGVGGAVAAGQIGSSDIKNGGVRAADLHKNSATAKKIRTGAVRSTDVRDGSLRPVDLSADVHDLIAQSVQGPAGPAGPVGPAGGVSGYEIVNNQASFSGNGLKTMTVSCPGAKVALGGGVRSGSSLTVASSYPSEGGASWTVTFKGGKGKGDISYSATAFATCATAE